MKPAQDHVFGQLYERREEVRIWLQRRLGREVSDEEVDAAWDDFIIDEALRQGRLEELLVREEADDDDEPAAEHGHKLH
jgi:hypothetical protein